jgi:DNA-binding CsgD family transcriptional regulator
MDLEPLDSLSARELECLRGVADLKPTAQIAFELDLQPGTVDSYLASAMKKLSVGDRRSAARILVARDEARKSGLGFLGVDDAAPIGTSLGARLPLPFATRGRPTNDLTFAQKLVAIGIAASVMMVAAGFYLLAVAALSRTF